MKLELHILQNFAPSNLNRDDTGAPKDCELGGVRRARISSQCFKRAIRDAFVTHELLPVGEFAARTKRLVEQVAERVDKQASSGPDRARSAVVKALESVGLKTDQDTGKTQYLLFLPKSALDALAAVVVRHLDVLGQAEEPKSAEEGDKKVKAKSKKAEKADAKQNADPEIKKSIQAILENGSRTPELALFGRMIADQPGWNVDAACQVAHAISTNRVSMEFDFYTAIDDLKKEDTSGSDMMGTISFNSACFYRYLVVDIDDLIKNLGSDAAALEQARRTVGALVKAAVLAIPTGKQSSMAAHNLPSLVMIDVRDKAEPRSLANAFVKPARATANHDLVTQSAAQLAQYAASLDKVYGIKGRKELAYIVLAPEEKVTSDFKHHLPTATPRDSLESLVDSAIAAAFGATT